MHAHSNYLISMCFIQISTVSVCTCCSHHLMNVVKQAIELNQKLQYMNSHQQCTIEAYRRELETCRQELLEAKVQLAGQQGTNGGGEDHGRVKTSEQELKMVGKLVQVTRGRERGRIGEREKEEMREEGREGRERRGEGTEERRGRGKEESYVDFCASNRSNEQTLLDLLQCNAETCYCVNFLVCSKSS